MRLQEIDNSMGLLAKTALDNCSESIAEMGELSMYSGRRKQHSGIYDTPTNRIPKDTPTLLQAFVDDVLLDEVNAKRNNSIYVTGKETFAENYGVVFNVIPFDSCSFTWHVYIEDLYSYMFDEDTWMRFLRLNHKGLKNADLSMFRNMDFDLDDGVEGLDHLYWTDAGMMTEMLECIMSYEGKHASNWNDYFVPNPDAVDEFKQGLRSEKDSTLYDALASYNEILIHGQYILVKPVEMERFKEEYDKKQA